MTAMASCGCFAPRCLHNTVQISAGSRYGGSGATPSSCQILPRFLKSSRARGGGVFTKTGSWKVLASGGGGQDSGKNRKQIQLDEEDLMTLEFGRLLGEAREATLAKILRRKAVPEATFLDIEEALKDKARAVSKPVTAPANLSQLKGDARNMGVSAMYERPQKVAGSEGELPDLISPPTRPKAVQGSVGAVRPQGKKLKVEDYDYGQLVRKPANANAMSGLAPVEAIAPMTMRRAKQNIALAKPPVDSSLLRKPVVSETSPVMTAAEGMDEASNSDENEQTPGGLSPEEAAAPMTMRRAKPVSTPARSLIDSSLLRKPFVSEASLVTIAVEGTEEALISDENEQAPRASSSNGLSLASPVAAGTGPPKSEAIPADLAAPPLQLPTPDDGVCPATLQGSNLISPVEGDPSNLEHRSAAVDNDLGADRFAGWSDEVKRAVLKSEAALQLEKQQSQAADGKSTIIRKSGLLRRPVAPQVVDRPSSNLTQSAQHHLQDTRPYVQKPVAPQVVSRPPSYPTQSAMKELRETRPYVPKPLPRAMPNIKQDERSEDSLQAISKKVMSTSDEKRTSSETDDTFWAQVEALLVSSTAVEVEILRLAADGVLASSGPMVGYIPAWELSSSRNIPSFSSWAQARGVDVTQQRSVADVVSHSREDERTITLKVEKLPVDEQELQPVIVNATERRNLWNLYKEEKAALLSALVGQKATVVVTGVDKNRQKLTMSEKRSEGEALGLARKKASLLASLKLGDVVTCVVKKVDSIGAFVEFEGVPALIHASELSWNRVTDPSSLISAGQEVTAKVSRLDRHLQRISLSLRQMQPDPLQETLESLVSGENAGGTTDFECLENEAELPEIPGLEPVLERLRQTDGMYGVVKGRKFRGTASATSFQVYLSEPLDDGYKLLARSGNAVQEILVQTSCSREEMKKAIVDCVVEEM